MPDHAPTQEEQALQSLFAHEGWAVLRRTLGEEWERLATYAVTQTFIGDEGARKLAHLQGRAEMIAALLDPERALALLRGPEESAPPSPVRPMPHRGRPRPKGF